MAVNSPVGLLLVLSLLSTKESSATIPAWKLFSGGKVAWQKVQLYVLSHPDLPQKAMKGALKVGKGTGDKMITDEFNGSANDRRRKNEGENTHCVFSRSISFDGLLLSAKNFNMHIVRETKNAEFHAFLAEHFAHLKNIELTENVANQESHPTPNSSGIPTQNDTNSPTPPLNTNIILTPPPSANKMSPHQSANDVLTPPQNTSNLSSQSSTSNTNSRTTTHPTFASIARQIMAKNAADKLIKNGQISQDTVNPSTSTATVQIAPSFLKGQLVAHKVVIDMRTVAPLGTLYGIVCALNHAGKNIVVGSTQSENDENSRELIIISEEENTTTSEVVD